MRGFLIFLAIAFPVLLADPSFWSLWRMETSRERVIYTRADGVSRGAWIGPLSPWPSWIPTPAGATLNVRSAFDPAPGDTAGGVAEVGTKGEAATIIAAYGRELVRLGWSVSTFRLDVASPDLPSRPLSWCLMQASLADGRGLLFRLDRAGIDRDGQLHWSAAAFPHPIGGKPGPC